MSQRQCLNRMPTMSRTFVDRRYDTKRMWDDWGSTEINFYIYTEEINHINILKVKHCAFYMSIYNFLDGFLPISKKPSYLLKYTIEVKSDKIRLKACFTVDFIQFERSTITFCLFIRHRSRVSIEYGTKLITFFLYMVVAGGFEDNPFIPNGIGDLRVK